MSSSASCSSNWGAFSESSRHSARRICTSRLLLRFSWPNLPSVRLLRPSHYVDSSDMSSFSVGKYDLTSVKRAISGGAPLGAEIIQQVKDRTGIIVAMGLGMTETMGGTAQQASLCWEEMQEAQGSTGRFQLGFEAKLVDDMGKGTVGLSYVRLLSLLMRTLYSRQSW